MREPGELKMEIEKLKLLMNKFQTEPLPGFSAPLAVTLAAVHALEWSLGIRDLMPHEPIEMASRLRDSLAKDKINKTIEDIFRYKERRHVD